MTRPFRELAAGETRMVAFVIKVDSGYLQSDAVRAIPADLDQWALRLPTNDAPKYIGLDGNIEPDPERYARPELSPVEVPTPDERAVETPSNDGDPGEAQTDIEIEEFVDAMVVFFDADEAQAACVRNEAYENVGELKTIDEGNAEPMVNIVRSCGLQEKVLEVGLSFSYTNEIAACVVGAMEPGEIDSFWAESAVLSDDELQEQYTNLVNSYPDCS